MYKRSELSWLVYNAPVDYVNLLLHGDIRKYLKNVTEYHPFENGTGKNKVLFHNGILAESIAHVFLQQKPAALNYEKYILPAPVTAYRQAKIRAFPQSADHSPICPIQLISYVTASFNSCKAQIKLMLPISIKSVKINTA